VPLVEAGEVAGEGVKYFVNKYWEETVRKAKDVDTLLLACTHYPILLPSIHEVVPRNVRVLVQSEFVAPSLEDYLRRHPEIETTLTSNGTQRFLTTDHTEGFDRLAEIFLGRPVVSKNVEL